MVSGLPDVSMHRVDDDAARPIALLVGAVVDEDAQVDADLVGREPDAVGRRHRVEHVRDERAELVVDLLDTAGGGGENGITDDADGTHGHPSSLRPCRPCPARYRRPPVVRMPLRMTDV